MVHPRDNRLCVASKEAVGGGLYQAPARLRSDRVNLLRRIAEVPLSITDGGVLARRPRVRAARLLGRPSLRRAGQAVGHCRCCCSGRRVDH
jgi:hypothetical protein